MDFIEKNLKQIKTGFIVLAFGMLFGLIYVLVTGQSESKEKKAQEGFSAIQAQVNKWNEQKLNPTAGLSKDKQPENSSVVVDVVQLKKELTDFTSKNLGSVASQMAGLSLADILISENNLSEALLVLKKVESNQSVLSNVLVLKKQGQLLADNNQCKEAIEVWEKLISNKKAEFATSEIRIKQALCYQKLNDLKKAEELLTQVKNNKTSGQEQSSLEAEKVLRLIQFNKNLNKAQGS